MDPDREQGGLNEEGIVIVGPPLAAGSPWTFNTLVVCSSTLLVLGSLAVSPQAQMAHPRGEISVWERLQREPSYRSWSEHVFQVAISLPVVK